MNKFKKLGTVIIALAMCLGLVTSCDTGSVKNIGGTTYKAVSGFYYSSDNGHTYGDGTKEYSVGNAVYMKVKFKVVSNKKSVSQVNVVLSIPNIESVEAKYLDGQVIKPEYDAKSNVTSYTFTASASKESEEQECVIQFVPKAVGTVTMTLVFDDNVDPSYDTQSTLVFVADQENEPEVTTVIDDSDPVISDAPTPTPTLVSESTEKTLETSETVIETEQTTTEISETTQESTTEET